MSTPSPEFPEAAPAPEPTTPTLSAGPVCAACGGQAVVNWRRRPTADELAAHVAAEQERRQERILLADPQQAAPVFPPLPTADDTTVTMYACGAHAIGMDAAALIHAGSCSAPNETDLPGCDCEPEPHPEDAPEPPSMLPDHWQTGGA
ncbi:hypothetical protein ACWCRD_02995 [Streptomyces sp. NPDC002092]